jgi:hypothetical protein
MVRLIKNLPSTECQIAGRAYTLPCFGDYENRGNIPVTSKGIWGTLAAAKAYLSGGGTDMKIRVVKIAAIAAILAMGPATVSAAYGQDKDGAGATISKQATSKDVGLPVYPGAKAHSDNDGDSPSLQMGLWGGAFGFKLAVMKMESKDTPDKVAEFYRKALAKYGTVLDCSNPSQQKNNSAGSNALKCDDDKPDKGMLFKAGTKEKQHIVGIQANGQGSLFQLVYVEARGDDKDKKADGR